MYADEFLTLAATLCKSKDAACVRTAVSRAYYAAFLTARDWLSSRRVDVEKLGVAHSQVVNALLASGEPDLEDAGFLLNGLRTLRNDADYQIDTLTHEAPKTAVQSVSDAQEVISTLNALRSKTDTELAGAIVQMRQAARDAGQPRRH